MSKKENNISDLINFLLINDIYFQNFWNKKSNITKKMILRKIKSIDNKFPDDHKYLINRFLALNKQMKRYSFKIPELKFKYSKIPDDLLFFLNNKDLQEELFQIANKKLLRFHSINGKANIIDFYGNIKETPNIIAKIESTECKEDYARDNILNLWDAVRFRFIVKDIKNVLILSEEIWHYFYYDIARCRNFYSTPQCFKQVNPYKGIHFQIEISKGRFIELQILTKLRELFSFFDYLIYYKNNFEVKYISNKEWFENLLFKFNIYELEKIISNDIFKKDNIITANK